MSCLVAWHRAVLEARHQGGAVDTQELEQKRSALAAYAHAAGGTDPFTEHVVQLPVGQLDKPLFLEALYRMETAVGVAWALGLLETVPPPEVGADFETLSGLFPLEGSPAPSIRDAKLRAQTELRNKVAEWAELTALARKKRDASPGESTAIPFSRAYERTRGLVWVSSDTPWIEDTAVNI